MSLICKETFSDIVAVYPIGADVIGYTVPFNVRMRTYTLAQLGVTGIDELTAKANGYYSIGEEYAVGNVVELEERESSLKSVTKETTAARMYEVTLTLIINENSDKSANLMDRLIAQRHDMVVQLANGEYLLVRTGECAYLCKGEENFAKNYQQKLTISVQNINGIQRINTITA